MREDLATLGLRSRRAHDLRRTFISLARSDGAHKDLLRLVTHSPNQADMMEAYSSFEWRIVCDEVFKLKAARSERGFVQVLGPAHTQPDAEWRALLDRCGLAHVAVRRSRHTTLAAV